MNTKEILQGIKSWTTNKLGDKAGYVEGYYYNKKFYKEAAHTTEITGAEKVIYIDKDTNREFRWDGTKYQLLKSEVDGSFVSEGTFTYRPTAGALDVESGAVGEGGAQIECVKGNTVAWNQLIQAEFVDLGLPSGTLWAKTNIDVTQPSGFAASEYQYDGSYFSWGNTDGHSANDGYDFGTSNDTEPYVSSAGAALTGDITYLNDAARKNGGAPWRMPTVGEFQELNANCDSEWVEVNGVAGRRFTSKINGNSIFFPASGCRYGTGLLIQGSSGLYWSASFSSAAGGYNLRLDSGGVNPVNNNYRFYGFTIRPVLSSGIITDGDGHKYYIRTSDKTAYDLTLIYGAGNEPTTPEQFEADYQKWFGKPLGYEEYDAGSLRSVEMTGIKTVGFNAWDGVYETGVISTDDGETITPTGSVAHAKNKFRVIPRETYCVYTPEHGVRIYFYDGNGVYITNITVSAGGTFTVPSNALLIRFQIDANDISAICINLSHSGARDGDYEPYWEHEASLPITSLTGKLNGTGESVVIFPDGMKKAGDVYDEIVKRGNQTVAIKRIGSADLSLIQFAHVTLNTYGYWTGTMSGAKGKFLGHNTGSNLVWPYGSSRGDSTFSGKDTDKGAIGLGTNGLFLITNNGSTTEPPTGILYYELETPQEYIIDDIDFPTEYPVDDYGTEEILADSAKSLAPTLDIRYGLNATDTLRNLPSKYVSAVDEQNFSEAQKERARKNIGVDGYKGQIENLQRSVTEIQSNMPYAIDSVISTFTLEETSSPIFTVNNQGAAAQYVNHMGGYLFLVKNGKVYAAKLNPSNWGKFADGTVVTSAIKEATECMIHVPDCHYLGNGATLQFGGMTPIDGGHVFASPHWVGAYQMSNGGHSRAGVGSAHSKTMSAFWNDAQAIHQDFGLANYQFHCLINALYQARYGNLNSESFLSNGNSRSSASWEAYRDLAHGMADALGDGTGCVSAVDSASVTRYVTKLFGFEDLFGKLWEFRSGIRFYMDGDVRHAVVYDGNVVSNTAEGRDISGVLSSANKQYATQMELGEYWDMLPKAVGGSDTTYYCDGYWAATGGQLLIVGGAANFGSRCGLSFAYSDNAFSAAYDVVGARMAFYGEPEIISGAQLLSML